MHDSGMGVEGPTACVLKQLNQDEHRYGSSELYFQALVQATTFVNLSTTSTDQSPNGPLNASLE